MSDPSNNAAIWYATDGYNPSTKGINGRRVAGASFLKGFVRHADVEEFVAVSEGPRGLKDFAAQMEQLGAQQPVRGERIHNIRRIAPLETVYFPAPNYAAELWRRQTLGADAYSICGVTHTTATTAVMQGQVDLRLAPQMEWDAVICTSEAVKASQLTQLEMIDAYITERFGKAPPRPQMPVIPLGLTCEDYAHDKTARARLRRRMGWKKDDIVVSTLSRLTPYGKFDPFPLFLALEAAQKQLPPRLRLHFVACGIYIDGHSQRIFEEGAAALMPSVSYTHLDGADAKARAEALSGADIFTFPIDNIQETFGLAPLEAMAAGLPQVTTNWDGMKDTVSADVGMRIPTRSLPESHGRGEAWGYHAGRLSYAQYGNTTSALTEVDLAAMTEAFITLAKDPDKRKAMGQAGVKRAKVLYDWSVIIPQYQELWGELSSIRKRYAADPKRNSNPVAPAPQKLFASYPSEVFPRGIGRCVTTSSAHSMEDIYALRGYERMGQPFEKPDILRRVLNHITASGPAGCIAQEAAKALSINPLTADRAYVWLMKYGFITRS